ncbi:MAG TPA: TfoX/Sxy family protein [Patescibacteria group bacterium]|nr:TfoX/Sxy family protein [Patescibacteria group bacterium]
MAVSEAYLRYVVDQLAVFGPVAPRRMFGGAGLYRNGTMFALIADDVLYFKVDDSNRQDYETMDSEPFRPYAGKTTVMSYYEVPADIVENRDELAAWAIGAYAAALRTRRGKKR